MKKLLVLVVFIIALAGGIVVWKNRLHPATGTPHIAGSQSEKPENGPAPESFDKARFSVDEPGSIWWVVNKTRPLPAGYEPPELGVPDVRLRLGSGEEQMHISSAVIPAVEAMFAAAETDGVKLVFGSGFRSESYQRTLYNGYVNTIGQAAADRTSARPGTSEHQTGLAFDVTTVSKQCHLDKCFADLAEGQWLATHAYEHGFIIRYLPDKESVTGYDYEPWHVRYIGKELAAEMRSTGMVTLEEFFGLPNAPDYP